MQSMANEYTMSIMEISMSDSNIEVIKNILSTIDPGHVSVTADGRVHIEDQDAARALRALPFAEGFEDASTNSQSLCVNIKSCADE
jgi:hypothetical protein